MSRRLHKQAFTTRPPRDKHGAPIHQIWQIVCEDWKYTWDNGSSMHAEKYRCLYGQYETLTEAIEAADRMAGHGRTIFAIVQTIYQDGDYVAVARPEKLDRPYLEMNKAPRGVRAGQRGRR